MLFAAQETPLFVLNDDEALFANERGRAEDASTRNITAHFKNNEEEEEEDRTRIEKKQQNDFPPAPAISFDCEMGVYCPGERRAERMRSKSSSGGKSAMGNEERMLRAER